MSGIPIDTKLVARLQDSAARLSASPGVRSFADWAPNEVVKPFADDVYTHLADRLREPLALYERTDYFVHRLTGEASHKRTATVIQPASGDAGRWKELPDDAWSDDIHDLSTFNPRMPELLDLARTMPGVPHDNPNVRGVFLTFRQEASGPKLVLADRELALLVDTGRGRLKQVPFSLEGPSDALAAARPFMHREGLPPDAMITRTNDLLIAIRDRNGITTDLPATQRVAITSHFGRRR